MQTAPTGTWPGGEEHNLLSSTGDVVNKDPPSLPEAMLNFVRDAMCIYIYIYSELVYIVTVHLYLILFILKERGKRKQTHREEGVSRRPKSRSRYSRRLSHVTFPSTRFTSLHLTLPSTLAGSHRLGEVHLTRGEAEVTLVLLPAALHCPPPR